MSSPATVTADAATRDEAVARAERIRAGIRSMNELQQDIADAYHARDWETLGYSTWDAYVSGEFGGSMPRLDRDERRELVVNLRAEGLSTRAIAVATGVHKDTVRNDLSTGENSPVDEPTPVIGINGKTYEPNQTADASEEPEELSQDAPASSPARPVTRKTPLPKFAADKVNELWRLTDGLLRVVKDERFQANRDSIRERCESELKLAEANLAAFHQALGIEKVTPES